MRKRKSPDKIKSSTGCGKETPQIKASTGCVIETAQIKMKPDSPDKKKI